MAIEFKEGTFRQMLEEGYLQELEFFQNNMSRLEYLGEHIFDFITYDSVICTELTRQAIIICKVINEASMFEHLVTK